MSTFMESLQNRRSYYMIGRDPVISDQKIEELLQQAVLHTPSAFNSQTSRLFLLLGEHHEKLWNIVEETLRAIVPAESFEPTEKKMKSFRDGYGTVLFFEDYKPLEALIPNAGSYADKFPDWSNHTAGMHQFVVWNLLEDAGYGASLQHYNSIIDDEVKKTWNIPEDWKLLAQMPFGSIKGQPGEKEFQPLDQRLFIYK